MTTLCYFGTTTLLNTKLAGPKAMIALLTKLIIGKAYNYAHSHGNAEAQENAEPKENAKELINAIEN